jgi:hypothetical protein
MKLSILKIRKLFLFTFAATLFLASCAKEDFDIIEEEVIENIESVMSITMRGVTAEHNAYATYCADDGIVFLNVSNNQLLLDTAIIIEDFMVNDFLIYYAHDGTEVASIGGAVFTEDLGGFEFTYVVLDAQAAITIVEANDQYVQGSMTGVFELFSGEEVEYSVQFTAIVINISPWCN